MYIYISSLLSQKCLNEDVCCYLTLNMKKNQMKTKNPNKQ